MDPKFQTSFIPKKPVVGGVNEPAGLSRPIGIFSVFMWFAFIITVLTTLALFGYKQVLNSQISQAEKDIVSAREAFQPETLKELVDVSSRITLTQRLLNSHVLTSQILDMLQNLILKKVRLNNFTLSSKENVPTISMDLEASSYNALAQQSIVFSKSTEIKNPQFTDFTVLDTGNITTKFTATLDPSLLSYKKVIDSLNTNQ
jgi:hypothetical protein